MADLNPIVKPPRVKDLVGEKFGRLTVVSYVGSTRSSSEWQCQCECGNTRVVLRTNLMNGQTTSCGCFRRETASVRHTTHGQRNSPEYKVWVSLIQRCCNPNDAGYSRYGERGIGVCERWRNSFEAFFEDMGKRPSSKHSIERQKNSEGYCKENCIWATSKEQTRNRRSNVVLVFEGRKQCLADWASEFGLRTDTLWRRLNKLGWPLERALREPARVVTSPNRQG